MRETPLPLKFDTASAISQGAREYQEDAMIADFSKGAEVGFAVLADGMGGHAAGDVASKIVVTEVFSELMFRRGDIAQGRGNLCQTLRGAADAANDCINAHVQSHPQTKGMGATLVSFVVIEDALHWISIGDSPLFLFRDNVLSQLNEDHSLAPHIDMLVRSGAMSEAEGENHPERNALTSVLLGSEIAQVDCPEEPLKLQPGDTVIVASDGLQFLKNDEIARILRERPFSRSSEISEALMTGVEALEDPDLDNVTLCVVQVQLAEAPALDTLQSAPPKCARSPRPWPFRKRTPTVGPAPAKSEPPDQVMSGPLE